MKELSRHGRHGGKLPLWYNYRLELLNMKHKLTWTFILIALLIAWPAEAQTESTRLAGVEVRILPDLDQPAVLVMIMANLPSDPVDSTTVSLKLPAAAGQPTAVAYLDPERGPINASYTTQPDGDTTWITLETSEQAIQVEYYIPYHRNNNNVSFTYTWLGGIAVDELVIRFWEPAQASSVATNANFELPVVQPDGRRYHQWWVGAVGQEQELATEISYVAPRPDFDPPPAAAVQQKTDPNILTSILTGLGGLLIGAGIGWLKANHRKLAKRTPRPKKTAYCHQCGRHLKPRDAFCRHCGVQVR